MVYKMRRNLAVSLVNCDPSGLSDTDFDTYKSIDFDFHVIDWSEDSTDINYRCDFSGLWDHCVIIERLK